MYYFGIGELLKKVGCDVEMINNSKSPVKGAYIENIRLKMILI